MRQRLEGLEATLDFLNNFEFDLPGHQDQDAAYECGFNFYHQCENGLVRDLSPDLYFMERHRVTR